MNLYSLVNDAIAELREWRKDNPDETEPHDMIHETADNSVPIYTGDLMRLAAENIQLAVSTPECGPAFDGEPTPVNIVAANVYEHVEQALWDAWREMEDETDKEEDADDAV